MLAESPIDLKPRFREFHECIGSIQDFDDASGFQIV